MTPTENTKPDETQAALYTPGPWHVKEQTRIESDSFGLIAALRGELSPHYKTETDASARLIAAAPDLLKALESMVRWTEIHGLNLADLINGQKSEVPVVIIAKKVIAEATARAA